MRKISLLIMGTILCLSCASESEKGVLTDIANVYDADTSYSKSFVSNDTESRTTFNVIIQNSVMADSLSPTVTTANSALMVYDALNADEKEKYTDIEVKLINAKKDTTSIHYSMSALKAISQKAKVYHQFSEALVSKNYENLSNIERAVEIPADFAQGLEAGIKQFETQYGNLKNYYTFGVAEERDHIGTIYQYQGYLVFSNGKKLPYLVVVDATSGQDQIVGYRLFPERS